MIIHVDVFLGIGKMALFVKLVMSPALNARAKIMVIVKVEAMGITYSLHPMMGCEKLPARILTWRLMEDVFYVMRTALTVLG
jgi:hypothetical protein